jgi:hypothetical protein
MIRWAEPLDAGNGWIKYRDRDSGMIFANVTEDCDRSEENMTNDITLCITSEEWHVTVRPMLNDERLAEVKKQFPDSRVVHSEIKPQDEPPF